MTDVEAHLARGGLTFATPHGQASPLLSLSSWYCSLQAACFDRQVTSGLTTGDEKGGRGGGGADGGLEERKGRGVSWK